MKKRKVEVAIFMVVDDNPEIQAYKMIVDARHQKFFTDMNISLETVAQQITAQQEKEEWTIIATFPASQLVTNSKETMLLESVNEYERRRLLELIKGFKK